MQVSSKEKFWLTAPITFFLLVMLGFPLLLDLIYSVSEVTFENLLSPRLQGFENYFETLQDPTYWNALAFSLKFGLTASLVQLILALFLAIYLEPLLARHPWLMAVLMAPMMVAPALIGLMYRLILHEFVGVIPYYLWEWVGDSPAFLGTENAFLTLVTIEILQWTPFALLILYTAYRAIPTHLREAARMDGANSAQLLLLVELPYMMPVILLTFFIRFIDSFRVFDNIYVLVGSGAGGTSTSLSIYIYKAFFRGGNIGQAVAASVLLFLAALLLIALLERFSRRMETT